MVLQYAGLLLLSLVVYRVLKLIPRYLNYRALKKIPGPECGFWLGKLPEIRKEAFMAPHKIWWKEVGYDAPLLRYSSVMGANMLAVFDPDIIKDILTAPASKDDARFYKSFFFLPAIVGKGMVTTEGEEWMRHRRTIQPAFSVSVLKAALEACVPEKVTRFLQYWIDAGEGQEIDVGLHLSALTLDVIGDAGFSYNCEGLSDIETWAEAAKQHQESSEETAPPELTDPLITSMTAFLKPDFTRMLFYVTGMGALDTMLNPKTRRMRTALNETVDGIIASAKKEQQLQPQNGTTNGSSSPKAKSLLQLLLNAKDPETKNAKNPGLTDLELRDEVKTFLLAGHETTSTWCYWALFALAKFPDVQEKLYQDVTGKAPNDIATQISLEEVESMKYLGAFLQEVLRLYPPVGMIGRLNRYEEKVAGYTIPKDTNLVVLTHLLHRHPNYWTDPETFSPERWLNGETASGMDTRNFTFLPFGAGGHNCIGYKFATIEAKLIMAHLVRALRVEIAPSQRDVKHEFTTIITMKAKPGLKIVIKPRKA